MVRVKLRYILSQIITGSRRYPSKKLNLNEYDILDVVKSSVKSLHGDRGLANALRAIRVKYVNADTMVVLFRCLREVHVELLQALALVKKIGDCEVFLRTIHVSGTLRSCYKHLRSYAKQDLIRLRRASTDPAERKLIQSKIDAHSKGVKEKAGKVPPVIEMDVDSCDSDFDEGSE